MEYAKLQGSFLRSATFKDADMAARGAWATLTMYCADQENAGRIVGCKAWNDRQWLSRTDCMRADVEQVVCSELARWADDDLVLNGYDKVAEASFRTLAEANRQRALDGWEKRRGNAGGTRDDSRRQEVDVPPALEKAAAAMPAASLPDATHRPTDRTTDRNTPPAAAGAAPPPKAGAAATTTSDDREPSPKAVRALRSILRRNTLPADTDAVIEWWRFLRQRGIRTFGDIRGFIAHAAESGVAYQRQVTAEIFDGWRRRSAS